MKYVRQFAVILTVSFMGEVLKSLIPLQIPASIYGLVLMLAALCLHIIPLEGCGEIFSRDYAADVYSGGCWVDRGLGQDQSDPDPVDHCDGCFHHSGHGCLRTCDTVGNTHGKPEEKRKSDGT